MENPFEKQGFVPLPDSDRYQDLTIGQRESVVLITLNRLKHDKRASRQAANNLDERLMGELGEALESFGSRPEVSSLMLASAHSLAFSVGAKIDIVLGAGFEEALGFVARAQELILKLHCCPKPMVAALNGWTFGGGLEVAMACDYRISGDRGNCLFGLPETSLGLIPGMGGTQNLSRLVGREKARYYMITAKADLTAASAKNDGLVDRVVPSSSLIEEVFRFTQTEKLAKTFAAAGAFSPKTGPSPDVQEAGGGAERGRIRREIKEWLAEWRPEQAVPGPGAPLAQAMIHFVLARTAPERYQEALLYEQEAFCRLVTTADGQEGVRALTEGRKPVFLGK